MKRFAIFLGIILIFYSTAAYYFSDQIIHFKTKTLEEDQKEQNILSLAKFGLDDHPLEVAIPLKDVTIQAWLFEPKSKKRCGSVITHGYTVTRYAVLKYAQFFYKLGCSSLVYDVRYHGLSTGNSSTYGYYEKDDLLAIIDWFKNKTGLKSSEIAIAGQSMGAAISLLALAKSKERFSFILADSSYSIATLVFRERAVVRYSRLILAMLPSAVWLASFRSGADLRDSAPEYFADLIRTPTLLMHSAADIATLPSHSERIFSKLSVKEKELHLTQWNAKHSENWDRNPKAYEEIVRSFIRRYRISPFFDLIGG
ncbi:alpha/beta fold hydrolase [Leptospira gomenensis]|uniref:Alpha/beta fold hydrolase n=1 Tax=Leptospira gomenensis TaxID=2484974 RepID=A0A5F1YKK4_9LEPT|nr:alpha/beta fold hydrolase [Leptospira gomenensis]TGK33303.1 alpha/beta fold hydrolase [Leptospira gomenensis]TGK45104.1 alpha/beta fold hydrolase [Leptospira gomenensis]TGK50889.1 alpha/beta fold hydrolase [Leptospira gomenensis]TGK56512.1 alpha/beta fold hydrolase [Leptospira gomenensis]